MSSEPEIGTSESEKKTTKLQVWGCRGSIARSETSMSRYGGSTSCVEVKSFNGTRVVLDMGSGSYSLGQEILRKFFGGGKDEAYSGGSILITHTHWDHIQGFPFFAPLFVPSQKWDVYGPRGAACSLKESLSGQMQYDYFPVSLEFLGADISYHDLNEGTFFIGGNKEDDKETKIEDERQKHLYCQEIGGDVKVSTHFLNHPCLTLGYRLEDSVTNVSICYITDHEPHDVRVATEGYKPSSEGKKKTPDDKHVEFLKGADLLLHDSQYTAEQYAAKVTWGHSTVEYVVDVALAAGVRRLGLFHHDPMRTDEQIDALVDLARERVALKQADYPPNFWNEPLQVFAAAEKMEIELEAGPKPINIHEVTRFGQIDSDEESEETKTKKKVATNGKIFLLFADPVEAKPIADQLRNGSDVEVYTDPMEALVAAEKNQPSLMLVQQDLPGCSGLEICRKVRQIGDWGENIPFLVQTSSQSIVEEHRAEGEEAGVTDWLSKPYSPEYVRTKVRIAMMRTVCRWIRAETPSDEEERLNALHSTGIMDTDPEDRFDRLTRIASRTFDVPIVLVSMVDKYRQWFKSCHGLCASETPRDQAFCSHAILQDDIFLVPDALLDDRFADNPLVVSGPRVRFYAGVPLAVGKGKQRFKLGTLCLIDSRPRDLDEEQMQILKDLATLVENELSVSITSQAENIFERRGLPNPSKSEGVAVSLVQPRTA